MKKVLLLLIISSATYTVQAQGLKDLVKKTTTKDSSGKSGISKILQKTGSATHSLSNDEVIAGLKEALSLGTGKAAQKLSGTDGFFKDAVIKILMPQEAQKVEKTLRNMGMGRQVDKAILSMNRAAEDAAKSAAPIFVDAIKGMSFQDAMGILKGGDHAATDYLKGKTTTSLTEAFRPVIESSLQKVDATQHWNTVFTTYNKFSTDKINTDLSAYVTEKALAGIFYQLAQEEKNIRQNPMARTSDLLKKVFSN
jgi:hypothetical protein